MTDATDGPIGPMDDPEDREARIAEYVLGTLGGAERAAFEAELTRDPGLQRAVAAWCERLQPLAESVPPVAPPAALRERILAAIDGPAGSDEPRRFGFSLTQWLAWTFGLSALAGVAAAALVFLFMPRVPEVGGYALLHNAQAADHGVIAMQVDPARRGMVLLAEAAAPASGHDYELWVLPFGKKPISLGVVKAGVREEKPIPGPALPYLKQGVSMAVSLEPAGGAPGGQPTGPIVFTGYFDSPQVH